MRNLANQAAGILEASRLRNQDAAESQADVGLFTDTMNAPTPEQIAKLPKWAQDHITKLDRERFVSVRALNEFCDLQTPSGIHYEELVCTGETTGPQAKRKYIQSHKIEVAHAGVNLSVFLAPKDDNQRNFGIQLQWGNDPNPTRNRHGRRRCAWPAGYNRRGGD